MTLLSVPERTGDISARRVEVPGHQNEPGCAFGVTVGSRYPVRVRQYTVVDLSPTRFDSLRFPIGYSESLLSGCKWLCRWSPWLPISFARYSRCGWWGWFDGSSKLLSAVCFLSTIHPSYPTSGALKSLAGYEWYDGSDSSSPKCTCYYCTCLQKQTSSYLHWRYRRQLSAWRARPDAR